MHRTRFLVTTALIAVLHLAGPGQAIAWIDDQNENRIDDRIEAVHASGLAAAYEYGDINGRMIIGVFDGTPVSYGIYVGYDHAPSAVDIAALQGYSLITPHPYDQIDYVRSQATYAQIQAIAGLPGVTRVEAIPMMYPTNHWGSRVTRSRDSRGLQGDQNYALFPSVQAELGLDGTGVVIAVLDTGVNDALDTVNPGYTGHESLVGKWLGGGEFFSGQPELNTGLNESMNPQDHGGDSYHGTHVAGSAMGTGGQDGFFAGVAPAARLVDCKVLSDAGAGFGSADGVAWCIHNMNNDWGLTGPDTIYAGIDVLNLSLGGLTESDGTDAGSQMMNAAMAAGLVVCIASGNDDAIDYMPSPAASDDAITVGASTHASTLDRSDDRVTSFSNEGPRDSDGDVDQRDEMKPNVCAPGAGIVSANGDFTTDGKAYHGLSGTSMATPHVAGVAALVRQANPSLTPSRIRQILENTAIHGIGTEKAARPDDPFAVDPNYNPADGWGEVDVYGACLEAMNSTSGVQVVRFRPVARPQDLEIDVHWWSQREYPFQGYNIQRAPDVGGAPGAFVQVNGVIVPGIGDPVLDADDNRTAYTFVDDDPALQLGTQYWYRVEWVETGGTPHQEPPAPVIFGELPRVATVFYHLVHNAPENDLFIRVGTSAARDPDNAEFFTIASNAQAAADSFLQGEPTNTGTATPGDRDIWWSIGFSVNDNIGGLIPPSLVQPWFLNVTEGGYVNRHGRLVDFSMFVNDAPGSSGGVLHVSNTPSPQVTVETVQSNMWIYEPNILDSGIASLNATAGSNGVSVTVDLLEGSAAAEVRIMRGSTERFEDRAELPGARLTAHGERTLEYVDGTVEPGSRYWYWVEIVAMDGASNWGGPLVTQASDLSTLRTTVLPASPNPVRNTTTFRYSLAADAARGGAIPVSLTLHDVQGRLVRTLKDAVETAGEYSVRWDARDDQAQPVPLGVYYYRFRAGSVVRTAKVTVVR